MRLAVKIAAGMFVWGAAKGYFAGRVQALPPAHRIARSVLTGPVEEELAFRGALERAAGPVASAVTFGLMHLPEHAARDPAYAARRVLETTLSGVVYSKAAAVGGLPAAIAAHGLHNLGTWVGRSLSPWQAQPWPPRS